MEETNDKAAKKIKKNGQSKMSNMSKLPSDNFQSCEASKSNKIGLSWWLLWEKVSL